jgi:hypothetical protein
MLKRLRRWLGWDSDTGPFDFGGVDMPVRQRPQAPPAKSAAVKVAPGKPSAARSASAQPPAKPKKPIDPREQALLEILDNPKLTLDRPPDDGFDPYNTGAFNRSASWERISRHKR